MFVWVTKKSEAEAAASASLYLFLLLGIQLLLEGDAELLPQALELLQVLLVLGVVLDLLLDTCISIVNVSQSESIQSGCVYRTDLRRF